MMLTGIRKLGKLLNAFFRPRRRCVKAPCEQMRRRRSRLHAKHFRVEGAQAHEAREVLDRSVRFAAPDAQEPAEQPCRREIRIEHKRPVDQCNAAIMVTDKIAERMARGERSIPHPGGQPAHRRDALRRLAPPVRCSAIGPQGACPQARTRWINTIPGLRTTGKPVRTAGREEICVRRFGLTRSPMDMSADAERALVLIVDDDEEVRTALLALMQSVDIDAACFSSTRELLETALYERPGCLVLDVRMPGLSGLDFQQLLASSGKVKPIVFLTAHGDIPMSVQAMKAGAVDFLTKPVRDQTLLDAVMLGIERDVAQRATAQIVKQHVDRYATLTPRERQVMREVAFGRLNKQIAFDLGIGEVAVKLHRGNVMRKMFADSVGTLIRAWEALPESVRTKGVSLDLSIVTREADFAKCGASGSDGP